MIISGWIRYLLLVFVASTVANVADGQVAVEKLVRFFSPELRKNEARLAAIDLELNSLPKLIDRPFASRYGFRSGNLQQEVGEHWAQIDLGKSESISRIVAVPVNVPVIGKRGAGYGFPRRFRIDVADNPEMNGAVTVVDRTAEDVPNPSAYPMDFPLEEVEGRYVRFVSTRHFAVEEGFIWALEELLVVSGNRAVSVGNDITASSSLELYPNWSASRLNDGLSSLGMPVNTEESPSNGHLSAEGTLQDSEKWLVVDLGRDFPIHEIRLLPVEAESFEHPGLRSFPRGYVVELADDESFTKVNWSFVYKKSNLVGFPGGRPVIISSGGKRGRYLRLRTTDLWGEGDKIGFALAEIQAYSGNENVALNKLVTASDSAVETASEKWFPAAVVDGFTSNNRIIEIPEHLELITKRGGLELEKEELIARNIQKKAQISATLGYGSAGILSIVIFAVGWKFKRQRVLRERELRVLREQIARDLHDDIGSNLGAIILLGEVGAAHSADSQSREDFNLIRDAADEASTSMRDILWLIQSSEIRLSDMVTKMRQSITMILGDKEVSLTVNPAEFRDVRLSLLFRRHMLFSFKETLNNIRKHSQASKVSVQLTVSADDFTFSIQDDGIGFDPVKAEHVGHGLHNLKRRAERLGGTLRIESSAGQGSEVTFTAPLLS